MVRTRHLNDVTCKNPEVVRRIITGASDDPLCLEGKNEQGEVVTFSLVVATAESEPDGYVRLQGLASIGSKKRRITVNIRPEEKRSGIAEVMLEKV